MSQKLQKKDYCIHKQVPHIMLVLKYGKINPTMGNLIYGHLGVFYMKRVH